MKAASARIILLCALFSNNLYAMRTQQMTQYISYHVDSDNEYASDEDSYFNNNDEEVRYASWTCQGDFSLTKSGGRKQNGGKKKKGYYDSGYYDYLTRKPFNTRLGHAADWLTDCDAIIEIGGGLNPISKYATNKTIIVVDPAINPYTSQPESLQQIVHSKKTFQEWDQEHLLNNKKYAVVIMGLGLQGMQKNAWARLYKLIEESHQTVIEISATYRTGRRQLRNIKKNTSKSITQTLQYDFSTSEYAQDFAGCSHVNPKRKMMLFEYVKKNEETNDQLLKKEIEQLLSQSDNE